MAFNQPQKKRSTLDRIASGLQGLGAGIQGRGPEFLALQQRQEQVLSDDRKRAAADDIRRAKMLFDQGDIESIVEMAQDRVAAIEELGGDPSDTMGILQLSSAALQGDEVAFQRLGTELNAGLASAIDAGFIKQDGTGSREFAALTRGLSEEDAETARRIKLGLDPRAVGASSKTVDIGGVPHIFDPVTQKMRPVEIEGAEVTSETVGESEAEIAELRKRGLDKGTLAGKTIDKGFTAIGKIRGNVLNIDRAVAALDGGASTGVVANFFPSIRAASIELDQVQNELALDVVGATTFGALSKGELDLARDTAIPKDLPQAELRQWLIAKKAAQTKLIDYYMKQIRFLDAGGTVIEFIAAQEQEQQNQPQEQTDFIFIDGQLVPNTGQ